MDSILDGAMIQTPLVDKFFKMGIDSAKKVSRNIGKTFNQMPI